MREAVARAEAARREALDLATKALAAGDSDAGMRLYLRAEYWREQARRLRLHRLSRRAGGKDGAEASDA